MPSATFADRRLSIAASTATANPAETSARTSVNEVCGERGERKRAGESPDASDVEIEGLGDQGGRDDGEKRRRPRSAHAHHDDHHEHDEQDDADRGQAARSPPRPARQRVAQRAHRAAAVFSPSGLATPSAAGTCCRKMITAMPTVKPSTTGQGM